MTAGTSLSCPTCNATLPPSATACPNCGSPVTNPGTPGAARTPPASDGGTTAFAWETLIQRLRELTIGEYEILTELGHGGMAAVYLAWHHALHKHVALKVMSPGVMLTEGMIERFGAEARTQARLEHPHIATVHGVRQDADLHYIVMQYVPGHSLAQVLQVENAAGRRLSIPVVRSLLWQIGSALSHAHREDVIHRDVKPGNVLLRANGDAVVTDFGIAKVLSNPSQTMTGTVVGTAPYMSPEQCYAADLTVASDQYSLGVVAYELLTGTPPFTGSSFAVMQAHVSETPAPITARRADCPPEVEAVVLRMLAKSRDDRFADIIDALEAIGAASAPTMPNDPVRRELVRLADAEGVRAGLGDVLRTPVNPTPDGIRPARPRVATPAPHTPVSGGRSPVPTTGSIASIRVTGERSELQEGEVSGLTVQLLDRRGSTVADRPVTWRSSHPDIVSVDEQGFVTARSAGQAVVTATCEGKTATIAVVVAQPPVASLEIIAPRNKLQRGERLHLTTRLRSAHDTVLTDRPVTWESSDQLIARVSADGRVVAGAPGIAAISATCETQRTHVAIEVVPTRSAWTATRTRRAARLGAAGGALAVISAVVMLWRGNGEPPSAQPPVAASPSAQPPVAASADAVAPQIARIDFTPPVRTFRVGDRMSLSAVPRDSLGNPVVAPIRWSLAGDGIAEIRADSVVFRGRGNVIITATAANARSSATINVMDSASLAARIAQVRLVAPPTGIRVNDTIAIEARVFDSRNAPRADRRVVWHSSNPAVIEVLPSGRLVARREGTAAVHATADGIPSQQLRLTVQESAPLPPATGTLRIGGNLPSDATLTLTNESGQVRALDRTATLDPGSYVLEFRASGYEPDKQTIRVRAGEIEIWTPTVRAVQPKTVDPPPRNTTAEEAALLTAVRDFVAAFNRKDARVVVPLLPDDKRDGWRQLLQARDVTGFNVSLVRNEPPRFAGDEATVQFSIRVRFRQANQNIEQNLQGVGSLQRSSGAFRILSLR